MSRFLLCVILVLGTSVLARGHELPDGEIERRVQVTVKPDRVLVQYSLAMNEATLEKELHKHGQKPAEALAAMWKQYQEIILPSLPKHMGLTVDRECFPLKPIRADYSGWSHTHLTCLLKAEVLLARQLKTIVVTDANFLDAPGNYRIAMRPRSGVRMKKSTVSPLVIRAQPVEMAKLTKEQKRAATRAQGEFSLKQGAPAEPVSLFNGKDLEGWYADVPDADNDPDIKPSFIVREGKLVSMGVPRGHLITKKAYNDYRLEVQYRFAGKPGNCGVLVHTDGKRPRALYKVFPASLEVQMQHQAAGDFWCIHEDIKVPNMEKRRTGPKGDPEPNAAAVTYWFELKRGVEGVSGGVDFVPHLIPDDSGVGTQVAAGDINGDGLPDVVSGNKKGTHIHLQVRRKVSEQESKDAQPKVVS